MSIFPSMGTLATKAKKFQPLGATCSGLGKTAEVLSNQAGKEVKVQFFIPR